MTGGMAERLAVELRRVALAVAASALEHATSNARAAARVRSIGSEISTTALRPARTRP